MRALVADCLNWLCTEDVEGADRRCTCRYGMRVGFRMRLQAMAAVQAKVLRLNSAAIADVTSGRVRRDLLPCLVVPAGNIRCPTT